MPDRHLPEGRRYRGSKVIKPLSRHLLVKDLVMGPVILILAFAGYQKATYLGWRVWIYLAFTVLVVWFWAILAIYLPNMSSALLAESDSKRIQKWLPKRRRKS